MVSCSRFIRITNSGARHHRSTNTTPSQFEIWLKVEVSRHLISSTFNFLNFFSFILTYRVRQHAVLFCTFHLPHLFTFLLFLFLFCFGLVGFFSICGNKLQDFCSIKYILKRIFLPFQQFATFWSSNFCET